MSELQQDITFEKPAENRLHQALKAGEFVLLFEQAAPAGECGPEACANRLEQWDHLLSEELAADGYAALALTDRAQDPSGWTAVEYAARLPEANRDRHLVYLSGRDLVPEEADRLLQVAANAGLRNLVAVSGETVWKERARETRKRTFTESVPLLELIRRRGSFHAGAAINPYCYTPFTLLGQYFKLARKVGAGADFCVAQAGWDMLKLQSLFWYLAGRDLVMPVMVRLFWLTGDSVRGILAGKYPGIHLSREFRQVLERELTYSQKQFEAAQYRRIELQAAGCRLLGASGIQLSGIDTPAAAGIAASRIRRALHDYPTFESWLAAYNEYLACTDMPLRSDAFYLYDRVLSRACPEDGFPAEANDPGDPHVGRGSRFLCGMRKFFFPHADTLPAGHGRLLKKMLAGCRSCRDCTLPKTMFICTGSCPKRFANGPCGGVRPDGRCEFGGGECVHHRIVRIAYSRGELSLLERPLHPVAADGTDPTVPKP